MSFLFLPVALFLGFPFALGVWVSALKLYRFLGKQTSSEKAFVTTLCVIAATVFLLTTPHWYLAREAWFVAGAVYVLYVGMGARHFFRLAKFLSRELDSNPDNDVPIPPETKK